LLGLEYLSLFMYIHGCSEKIQTSIYSMYLVLGANKLKFGHTHFSHSWHPCSRHLRLYLMEDIVFGTGMVLSLCDSLTTHAMWLV